MKITINGEERELQVADLRGLLDALGLENRNLAIEHNGRIVEEGEALEQIAVREGDRLEIVRFVGGG